jgi:hypothetical protein
MSNQNLPPTRTVRSKGAAKVRLALLLACVASAGAAAFPPGPSAPLASYPPGPSAPLASYPPGPSAPLADLPPGPGAPAVAD